MDPAHFCRIFFGLATAPGISGILFPSFRQRILDYGSRSTAPKPPAGTETSKHEHPGLLEYAASFEVPHTWFTHFYVVSVASSIFWAFQIITHGPVFQYLVSHSHQASSGSPTMTVNQVFLAWLLMALQGSRRLYECLTLTKPSQSKMWVGHWALGIAYYIVMGLSVWVEGISALNVVKSPANLFAKPSMKTFIAMPIFLIASGIQHDCHEHLASLKKYTLPQRPMFRLMVCPHYTNECLIYVALAIVAAPRGQILNKTLLTGLMFVIANLAITADSSRKWYIQKFGAEKLKGRWRMVPYVY